MPSCAGGDGSRHSFAAQLTGSDRLNQVPSAGRKSASVSIRTIPLFEYPPPSRVLRSSKRDETGGLHVHNVHVLQ